MRMRLAGQRMPAIVAEENLVWSFECGKAIRTGGWKEEVGSGAGGGTTGIGKPAKHDNLRIYFAFTTKKMLFSRIFIR